MSNPHGPGSPDWEEDVPPRRVKFRRMTDEEIAEDEARREEYKEQYEEYYRGLQEEARREAENDDQRP